MKPMQPIALLLLSASLVACASSDSEQPKLDYQTDNQKIVSLDVPPDLTNPNQGDRYQLPAGSGSVRASDLNRAQAQANQRANSPVLANVTNMKIERQGNERWLNIANKTPSEVWTMLRIFWQEQGFVIAKEEPGIGYMETDWAENRAKLPQDGLRRLFDKIGLGSVYSTGERDKFTIRLERSGSGTNIFFTHRGMEEVYADSNKDRTIWQPAANNPNLEAAMLGRFMQYLGADEQKIQQEMTHPNSTSGDLATLNGNSLIVRGSQERNWRRVSLALDRIGLVVKGENTERQAFLVQAAPNEGEAIRNQKPGFFARLFGASNEPKNTEQLPEFVVAVQPQNNNTSRIILANKDGTPYQGADAQTWLSRLYTELR